MGDTGVLPGVRILNGAEELAAAWGMAYADQGFHVEDQFGRRWGLFPLLQDSEKRHPTRKRVRLSNNSTLPAVEVELKLNGNSTCVVETRTGRPFSPFLGSACLHSRRQSWFLVSEES